MQDSLLPEAEKIFTGSLAGVDAGTGAIGSLPTFSLVLLAPVLAAIAHRLGDRGRRTNRLFNLGLVVAAGAVLLVMVWIVGANRLAAGNIEISRDAAPRGFENSPRPGFWPSRPAPTRPCSSSRAATSPKRQDVRSKSHR